MKRISTALAALALAGIAGSAQAAVNVWTTSFDAGYFENVGPFTYNLLQVNFGGGTLTPSEALPNFGSQYFRNETGGTTEFIVQGLGAHSDLHLSFDLAFLDSWDGLDGTITPDILFLTLDGDPFDELTSNNASGSSADYGAGTVVSPLAHYAQNGSWQDVVVHYDLIIPHTAANFVFGIRFGGAGFQGGFDESWGIDNFSLAATARDAIPEPAAWAMMIAGFGLAGTALRRRRAFA